MGKRWLLTFLRIMLLLVVAAICFIHIQVSADVGLKHRLQPADDSIVPDPLPDGCIDAVPPREPVPACCVSGYVFVDGVIVDGAEVTIESTHGQVTIYTQKHLGRPKLPPYYRTSLSDSPLKVKPGEKITITVQYSGYTKTFLHTAQENGQRFDVDISPPSDIPVALGQIQGSGEAGKFDTPYDIAADTVGNIYILDGTSNQVQVFTPDGTFLLRWGEKGILPGQLELPLSIDLNSQDKVYIADSIAGAIHIFSSDGVYRNSLKSWRYPDGSEGRFGLPFGLSFDAWDNLYVVDVTLDRVLKFDPNLQFIAAWDGHNSAGRVLTDPVAIDVAQDGTIYVADSSNDRVVVLSDQGDYQNAWPLAPQSITRGIAADNSGHIYVIEQGRGDRQNSRIVKFDTNGTILRVWDAFGSADGQVQYPLGVAISDAVIYIADMGNNRIVRINSSDEWLLPHWGSRSRSPTQITYPYGMSFDPNGQLYVADGGTGRIFRLADDLSITKSWDQILSYPDPLQGPRDLAFDKQGILYFTDADRLFAVRIENDTLLLVDVVGGFGSDDAGFNGAAGVVIGPNDYVFVADQFNNRLKIYRLENSRLVQYPSIVLWQDRETAANETFSNPASLVFNYEGHLYVADTYHHRIVKFQITNGPTLQHLETWTSFNNGSELFRYPDYIAVDTRNHVYVASGDGVNAKILELNQEGALQNVIGNQGAGPGEFTGVGGFTLNAEDTLFVGDIHRIMKFKSVTSRKPIANIVHFSPNATAYTSGTGALKVMGRGQDSDQTDIIRRYEWRFENQWPGKHNPVIYTTTFEPEVHLQYANFAEGPYSVSLRVWDDEGQSSEWVTVTDQIYVQPLPAATPSPTLIPTGMPPAPTRTPSVPPATCAKKWTLLLYLVGDYRDNGALLKRYTDVLTQLRVRNNPCVQIALQMDGPASIGDTTPIADTRRWLFSDQDPQPEQLGELRMDDPETLANFVRWGQQNLPATHYYLAIANHAQAVQGIGWDITTGDNAYLTVAEISQALDQPGIAPIDILHLDGCSMNVLEVGYQLREVTDYLIASQYIAWSFFAYDDYGVEVTDEMTAATFAEKIVMRYKVYAQSAEVPATLTALNLKRISAVTAALNDLVVPLKAWVVRHPAARRRTLYEIRTQTQTFDSNGDFLNNPLDDYIDLLDWARHVYQATEGCEAAGRNLDRVLSCDIRDAADVLIRELQGQIESESEAPFVLRNEVHTATLPPRYQNGVEVNLAQSHGVSIYYPCVMVNVDGSIPSNLTCIDENQTNAAMLSQSQSITYTTVYRDYVHERLFEFTFASYWDELLEISLGAPAPNTPDEALSSPEGPLAPGTPDLPQLQAVQSYILRVDTDANGRISPGDLIQVTTQITNTGNTTATNAILEQELGDYLEIVDEAMKELFSSTPLTSEIPIGNVLPQASLTVTFPVKVSAVVPGEVVDLAVNAAIHADNLPRSQPTTDPSGKPLRIIISPRQHNLFLPSIQR